MAKDWTEEEIAILRTRRMQRIPVPQIAAELGRPVPATYARARMIGTRVMDRRAWDAEQTAALVRMDAEGMLIKDIARALNRTEVSVRWKLEDIGLSGKRLRRWTSGEIKRLERLVAAGGDVEAFARKTGRPVEAVVAKAKEVGAVAKKRVYWSVAAETRLRAGLDDLVAVAGDLGMSIEAVVGKARKLGLVGKANDVRGMDAQIRAAVGDGGGIDALGLRTGKSARALRARAEAIGALRAIRVDRRVGETEARTIAVAVMERGVTAVAKEARRDVRTVKQVVAEQATTRKPFVFAAARRQAPRADAEADARAVEAFLVANRVTKAGDEGISSIVLSLRRRGYSVVGDIDCGFVVDGRVALADGRALREYASARGIG